MQPFWGAIKLARAAPYALRGACSRDPHTGPRGGMGGTLITAFAVRDVESDRQPTCPLAGERKRIMRGLAPSEATGPRDGKVHGETRLDL